MVCGALSCYSWLLWVLGSLSGRAVFCRSGGRLGDETDVGRVHGVVAVDALFRPSARLATKSSSSSSFRGEMATASCLSPEIFAIDTSKYRT